MINEQANDSERKSPPEDAQPQSPADRPASEQAPTGTQGPQGEPQPPQSPEETIAALRAEAAELKDKLLRAHAEVENIRKRSEREREETAKYAISKLARDIVGVGDNFQRAIEAVPAEAAERDPALKSFLEGVTMTERELLNALERYGIKRMVPKDQLFNPHLHQAVMEIERSDVASGTIVQVFQAGFTIEDRVLRPAMVGVAKGGPKVQQAPEASATGTPSVANDDTPPGKDAG